MEINWLATIVAALSSFVVGFVYYHPKVFGTAWMQANGLTEEKIRQGNMVKTYGITLVMAILAAMFLNYAVSHDPMGYHPFVHGAWHGAQTSLFLALPVVMTNGLFEQRSFKHILINWGYWLVNLAVMGGILAVWK